MLNPWRKHMLKNMLNSSLNHQFLLQSLSCPIVLNYTQAEALKKKGLIQIDTIEGYNTFFKVAPISKPNVDQLKWEDYISQNLQRFSV